MPTNPQPAGYLPVYDPEPVNIAAETPAAPIDRLPGDIRSLLDVTDDALDKARAAGVLHGAGLEHSLADTLRELNERITTALRVARHARRDHLDAEARFAGYVDQTTKDYTALEHAYERLSDRHLADEGADSVRALLDALNTIKAQEGRTVTAAANIAVRTAAEALDEWHRRGHERNNTDGLPGADAPELAALEELEVLEPLRRGDLAEVVADGAANLSPRYLRRADRNPPQAETLPLQTFDKPATLDRLICQRPECGLPISEHRAHHEPDDGAPHGPEGVFAVDTHGLYCPTPPA